jgi:hypothetical protein
MEQENSDLQVFRLSKELVNCSILDRDYVESIFIDMCEAEVAHPPYQRFALEFDLDTFLELLRIICFDWDDEKQRRNVRDGLSSVRKIFIEYFIDDLILCGRPKTEKKFYCPLVKGRFVKVLHNNSTEQTWFNFENKPENVIMTISWWIFAFFLVLLSTKNIKKTTKIHECMTRRKVPDSKKYRKGYPYTTTLTIGKVTENYDGSEFTGVSRRPHLRRGHVRTQHYGPRNEMTKKVFIPSVFVNGSEDLKSNRVAYNVSFAA